MSLASGKVYSNSSSSFELLVLLKATQRGKSYTNYGGMLMMSRSSKITGLTVTLKTFEKALILAT